MLKEIKLIGEQKKVLFLPPQNPIQIKGVAGSGKTTVALYRAKHLLETQSNLFQEAKIVIFTFNKTLAAYIKAVSPFISGGYKKDIDTVEPFSKKGLNVDIVNFHSWAYRFAGIEYNSTIMDRDKVKVINQIKIDLKDEGITKIIKKSPDFFIEEISWIKGKIFTDEQEYIDAKRSGRGNTDRVTKKDKITIWKVYKKYNKQLNKLNKVDFDDYAILSLNKINNDLNFIQPYTHIIIDEAQDLNKAQMLTISKLVSTDTNSISIIADAAQKIFKSGFTWSEIGLNVRGGRTIEFKKNYRNSFYIAKASASLLEHEKDKSEFTEIETSSKDGNKPIIGYFNDKDTKFKYIINQLDTLKNNHNLSSTVILSRTHNGVAHIKNYLIKNSFEIEEIKSNKSVSYNSDSIKLCTMSSIKGLEFNNVFIIDLNDDIIPLPSGFIDEEDEYHISTERRLLYTCMTRAKHNLFLLSNDKATRYLSEIDKKYIKEV
ncbi:MAG: 3'-5' exonuclease [Sulfurimonas sp.]